jgi:predicted secreted protein
MINQNQNLTAYGSIRTQLPLIIIGSLSLMASLAWNEAIKSVIDHYYPDNSTQDNYVRKIIYATIISIIMILVIYGITKYAMYEEKHSK